MDPMENQPQIKAAYRLGLGLRLFVTGVIVATGLGFVIGIPFVVGDGNLVLTIIYLAIMLLILAIIVPVIRSAWRPAIIITENSVLVERLFSYRSFPLAEVSGFRVFPQQGIALYFSNSKKRVLFSPYLEKTRELYTWVENNFADLDAEDIQKEIRELEANTPEGPETDRLAARIEAASSAIKHLTRLCGIIYLWGFIFPRPYELVIFLLVLFPLIGLFLAAVNKDIVTVNHYWPSIKPSVAYMVCGTVVLTFRAFKDYSIIYSQHLWLAGGAVALIVFALGFLPFIGSPEFKARKAAAPIFLSIFLLIYTYGATIHANCLLDTSTPQVHWVMILDKRVSSSSNSITYYLKIAPWGEFSEPYDLSVSSHLYNSALVNRYIIIHEKQGFLQIKWYYPVLYKWTGLIYKYESD